MKKPDDPNIGLEKLFSPSAFLPTPNATGKKSYTLIFVSSYCQFSHQLAILRKMLMILYPESKFLKNFFDVDHF